MQSTVLRQGRNQDERFPTFVAYVCLLTGLQCFVVFQMTSPAAETLEHLAA